MDIIVDVFFNVFEVGGGQFSLKRYDFLKVQ